MGRFWFGILALSLYFWDSKSMGDELEGVKMPEQVRVGDHSLKLNGMALRKVYKFGIPVKVYVAGLYLQEPSHDWEKIVADGRPKYLEMEFLRTVEKDSITDAWEKAIFSGCLEACDKNKGPLREFNALMGEMRKGQRISIAFYPEYLEVDQQGRQPRKGKVKSPSFTKNLLGIFIGPKMFSSEVKEALLGSGCHDTGFKCSAK